ncbi:hypothetical protein [Saccharothrix saharensis]|uniref:hypothetical protein n=1 Tax=Saccharothrix saharensis TaxID=571190 RepID=UPI0011504122|nr:hypothetical protein [Saccharothrix saharensis]
MTRLVDVLLPQRGSREPLGVYGEVVSPAPPLDGDAAVRLLAERAVAVRPGFAVTPENAEVVAEVCRRPSSRPRAGCGRCP